MEDKELVFNRKMRHHEQIIKKLNDDKNYHNNKFDEQINSIAKKGNEQIQELKKEKAEKTKNYNDEIEDHEYLVMKYKEKKNECTMKKEEELAKMYENDKNRKEESSDSEERVWR